MQLNFLGPMQKRFKAGVHFFKVYEQFVNSMTVPKLQSMVKSMYKEI